MDRVPYTGNIFVQSNTGWVLVNVCVMDFGSIFLLTMREFTTGLCQMPPYLIFHQKFSLLSPDPDENLYFWVF